VLFGDLVGFTPLSEKRDAEDVRELLSRYFAECRVIIGRYGGTVEKFIGDAVMAVWGVPVAHEDDAERAVRAGLELVAAIEGIGDDVDEPGLAMRVGVVTGEVAVTIGATAEGMVAGDAVNTAARVQSVASPGQVWVDAPTRSLTAAAIAFEDRGEHELKGKSEPQHLFSALAVVADVGGVGRVDGLEAPITGRDRELRLLKELYHATEESGRPQLVVLDGEPGLGKSRLAREFEKYCDGLTTTIRWHRGRCLAYGDGVAFWALAEAVRNRLGLDQEDDGGDLSYRLDVGLAEYVPDLDERDWLRPRIASLVGSGSGPTFARDDLFAAWTTFFERVSGEGNDSVVLVIDDAQHADDGLLDFIDYLLTNARRSIFVLALARPELHARRPALGGRRATVMHLGPLSDDAMSALLGGLVHGLPETTLAALVSSADGVPLYAVETVRALIDRDLVIPQGGRYIMADSAAVDLDEIGAPASLQALVAARLDALEPDERRVVLDASVLGLSFTRDGLAYVGEDSEVLDSTLDALQRKEILVLQRDRFSAERGQYRFVQSVVRQIAYATQSKRDRKARHLAAARYLESDPDVGDDLAVVIAQHLMDAVDASSPGDADVAALTEEAREYLETGAGHARSVGATAEALRLLEAALERCDTPELEARICLSAATAAGESGDFERWQELAERAIALHDDLGDPIGAGLAVDELAQARFWLTGRAPIDMLQERWTSLDGTPGAELALSRLAQAMTRHYVGTGDAATALRFAERALLHAEARADARNIASVHIMMGHCYLNMSAPQTAAALTLSAATIAQENDLTELHARALNHLASSAASRDLEEAMDFGRQGMAASKKCGIAWYRDYTSGNYSLALWNAGRLEEARTVAHDVLDTCVLPGMPYLAGTVDTWCSEAMGVEPRAVDEDDRPDDRPAEAWRAALNLARARVRGELASMGWMVEQAMADTVVANGLDDDFMFLWPPLVETALAAHDVPLAERLLEPVAAAGWGGLSPAVRAHFLRLRGLVGAARGDDPEKVEKDMRDGVSAFDAFGATGLRARAQEELARWLADQGRASDAAPLWEQVRTTYTDIGATGWLARLDSSLAPAQFAER